MKYEVDAKNMTKQEILDWVSEIEKVAIENNLMRNEVRHIDNSGDDYDTYFMWDVKHTIDGIRSFINYENWADSIAYCVKMLGWWIDFYMTPDYKVNVKHVPTGNIIETSYRLAKKAVEMGILEFV